MAVRRHKEEPLSERQFKSGVFDVDYTAYEEEVMPQDNRKLSAIEKERMMRDEELSERKSRTARMKEEMNQNGGDGKRAFNTKFGAFSGAGTVDPSDVGGSDAKVTVTAEQKAELKKQGVNTDHLEEGDEIALSNIRWDRPKGE